MIDSRDALWQLLPAYIRQQDALSGGPLQQFLGIIGDQAVLLERDLQQMYDDCFIETCQPWIVPYIADLLGYVAPDPAATIGPGVTPRREVGNLLGFRRRSGSAKLIDELAAQVAGWPAESREFYRLLAVCQHLDHVHPDRLGTLDLHSARELERLVRSPFGRALIGDVRRCSSPESPGWADVAGLGVGVHRLRAYGVSRTTAHRTENVEGCFTFSILGNDAQLFTSGGLAPEPVTRFELELDAEPGDKPAQADPALYGEAGAMMIWVAGWPGRDPEGAAANQPIPAKAIVPADLSGWSCRVPRDHVALDPELGRIMFPAGQTAGHPLRVTVSYRYGFAMDLGGGEYARRALPMPAYVSRRRVHAREAGPAPVGEFSSIAEAVADWQAQRAQQRGAGVDAQGPTAFPALLVELVESGAYRGALDLDLGADESVWLVAGPLARPVLRISDSDAGSADALAVRGAAGSRFVMDGVMLAGRGLRLSPGDAREDADAGEAANDLCEVLIRHCTLVPGWGLEHDCEPAHPADPSVVIDGSRLCLRIDHSIVGAIRANLDPEGGPPATILISDSIVDATSETRSAISSPGDGVAYASLEVSRSTVVGAVSVHMLRLGEDSLFDGIVTVARRQTGCVRYSYVPQGSRTPKQHQCQPAAALQAARSAEQPDKHDPGKLARDLADVQLKIAPRFMAVRYGSPDYLRLTTCTPIEIARGTSDRSEMGVYHDLYEPQRLDRLQASLADATPAEFDASVLIMS
jgi:hypothetical protein